MSLVDLLRSSIFVLAQWFGGSFGASIVVASLVLRIAMLPVTLRATRRRLILEAKMRALAPELERLKKRYAERPQELILATRRLHEEKGIKMVDGRSLLDMVIQFPPAALLYSAIGRVARDAGGFLWVRSLVAPDRALALLAAAISGGAAWFAARSPETWSAASLAPIAITGVITYLFLSHISAGVALYSITNSVVAAVEQAVVRRSLARANA
jgi:YidC/Oxa1 family membrane protein insertase